MQYLVILRRQVQNVADWFRRIPIYPSGGQSFILRIRPPPTFNERSFTAPLRGQPELRSPVAFARYWADFRPAKSVSRNVNADASASLTNLMLST